MRLVFQAIPIVLLLLGCGENLSVEQKIIATLQTMEEEAESGQHLQFMGHVSASFSAQRGLMDRFEFRRYMIVQIAQHRRMHATFFPIHVRELDEDTASADFRILVTGGGGLLPENGQLFEAQTQWLLEGGDWMLAMADWKAAQLPNK